MRFDCAAIILAGGKSSRFGRDKALLPWGNSSFIETLVVRLSNICNEVLVVANERQRFPESNARVICDVIPEKNSLGGLYSGLLHSNKNTNFVCACDMPLLRPEIVNYLLEQSADFDVVIPQAEGRWQPLCAVYTKTCLPWIESQISKNNLRMTDWLESVRVHTVAEKELRTLDPALESFRNINHQADYQQLMSTLF